MRQMSRHSCGRIPVRLRPLDGWWQQIVMAGEFFYSVCVATASDDDARYRFVATIDNLPMTSEAVRQRYFAVSLTHVGSSKQPLELSLTTDPARREAWIRAHYKGQSTKLAQLQELLRMADESAPAPSQLEAAVASITDPEQRAAIEEQLRAYETRFSDQEGTILELSKRNTTDEEIVKKLAAGLIAQLQDQEAPLGQADPSQVSRRRFPLFSFLV
jgi:uncharacterized coiled-coil protein SlyX